jgi:hypothetical protein
MFLLSTTRLARVQLCAHTFLSPFGNELMKHKAREERDAMHENQYLGASQGIKHVF